jgi:hypothetical protein
MKVGDLVKHIYDYPNQVGIIIGFAQCSAPKGLPIIHWSGGEKSSNMAYHLEVYDESR